MPDTDNPDGIFCDCGDSLLPGIPVGFWEPIRLLELTREKFCFPSLSGLSLSSENDYLHAGTYSEHPTAGPEQTAFYQAHYIAFPVWQIIGLTVGLVGHTLTDISIGLFPDLSKCFSTGGYDIADYAILYLTELDPLWNDDELGHLLNPEAILFANPGAQAACAADAIAASAGWPVDALFWCAGSWGSMYPYSGTVPGPVGELTTASLLAARTLAKLNREFLEAVTSGEEAMCGKRYTGLIKKSQYRLQLVYPIASTEGPTCCPPIGRNTMLWGTGKAFPIYGEDFSFLVFRKKSCCAR
jgi:conjugal transfer pilus assembly protein TraU